MSKTRAKKIKLLLFDVDGVMTDGKLWILPSQPHPSKTGLGGAPTDEIEAKGFHAHDGTAISLARLGGVKTGLITKRISETVALRARDLKLDYVYQGIIVKLRTFEEILEKEKIAASEAAYVGDDIIDLPIMRRCGLAIAVANARDEVKQEAHWVTPHGGGDGAIRDAVEYILKAQGSWDAAVKSYLESGDPPK
jgi:3-deoxy-D-manno-octulosonate 8-phosphate phosphatase (KDO 8-P phosphatase)